MSNDNLREDYESRSNATGEWLEIAYANARGSTVLAKEPGLERLAIYLMGQGMEAVTKGLARGAGVSDKEIGRRNHNYLKEFLALLNNSYVRIGGVKEIIDTLWQQFTYHKLPIAGINELRLMINHATAPGRKDWQDLTEDERRDARKFFNSMLLLSPEDVRRRFDLLASLENKTNFVRHSLNAKMSRLIGTNIILKRPGPGEDFTDSIVAQVSKSCRRHLGVKRLNKTQKASISEIVRLLPIYNEEQFKAELDEMGWKVPIEFVLHERIDMGMLNVKLLIIGSIVWPHTSFVRYPPPSAAPDTFIEAVKQRKIGSSHYSEEVGVFREVELLAEKSLQIVKAAMEAHRGAYLVPQIAYAD